MTREEFREKFEKRGMGGFRGDGAQIIERPDWPERGDGDVQIPPQPTVPVVPQGEQPEDMPVPDFSEGFAPGQMPASPMPQDGEDMPLPNMPAGVTPPQGGGQWVQQYPASGELIREFTMTEGSNYYHFVRPVE